MLSTRARVAAGERRPFLVVDHTSTVAAAFSLRKISSNYSGSAIRIRRNQDNVEADIGFTPQGDLDEAAFSAHLAGSSPVSTHGYVVTWYDQSGNSRNASQSNSSYQPELVLSAFNSRACVEFDSNNTALSLGNQLGSILAGSSAAYTVFLGWRPDSLGSNQTIFGKIGNDTDDPFTNNLRGPNFVIDGGNTRAEMSSRNGAGSNIVRDYYVPSLVEQITRMEIDLAQGTASDRIKITTDGTSTSTTTLTSGAGTGVYTDLSTNFWIGNRGPLGNGNALDGGIAEFIFYTNLLSSTDSSAVESNMMTYWEI